MNETVSRGCFTCAKCKSRHANMNDALSHSWDMSCYVSIYCEQRHNIIGYVTRNIIADNSIVLIKMNACPLASLPISNEYEIGLMCISSTSPEWN
jgi:hypothetical protein